MKRKIKRYGNIPVMNSWEEMMMLNEYGDFLTVPEICHILDVGKNTVYEMLKNKQIRNFRIGKRYKITRDAVVDFILYEQQK